MPAAGLESSRQSRQFACFQGGGPGVLTVTAGPIFKPWKIIRTAMPNDSATPHPLQLDVEQVRDLVQAENDFLLLDCREPPEHAFCQIAGATLLPIRELEHRVDDLREHLSRRIIVYCHHGVRSLHVTHWLRQRGFTHAQSMRGGIDAWSQRVDPAVPRY